MSANRQQAEPQHTASAVGETVGKNVGENRSRNFARNISKNVNGGRVLLGGLCVASLTLLAMIGQQTVRGSMGEAARSGGWWSEPALAPGVALVITLVASGIAFLRAKREQINWRDGVRTYGQIAIIAGCMLAAVGLMKALGFALSVLIFATVVAWIGGYRRSKLLAISVGTTVAMVLIFRVGFAIWFPRPALFKWIDFPFWLQAIL